MSEENKAIDDLIKVYRGEQKRLTEVFEASQAELDTLQQSNDKVGLRVVNLREAIKNLKKVTYGMPSEWDERVKEL